MPTDRPATAACRCSHGFSCHVCEGCRDHHEPDCPLDKPATAALIPAWSYTRLGWVRIYLRCPDHGPFCSGPECCCRDLHWRPWALARCGRWRSLRGRMFPTKPRTHRV